MFANKQDIKNGRSLFMIFNHLFKPEDGNKHYGNKHYGKRFTKFISVLSKAMNCAEITDKLRLPRLNKVKWHIQASCATCGDGLREGLDWLTLQLDNSKGV